MFSRATVLTKLPRALATRLTFRPNNRFRLSWPGTAAGFTLIELMVVVAIIAGCVMLAMPFINTRNTQTKSALRELTVLSRELHTKAKLQGAVYRLVIEMPVQPDYGDKIPQRYWVEKSNSQTVISSKAEADSNALAKETDPEKRKDPRGFEEDKQILKKPKELPRGMMFEKIQLTRVKDEISVGKAYIHYLPQGLADEAAIHIKGEKNASWTILIHPLTGKAELISKAMSLREAKGQ